MEYKGHEVVVALVGVLNSDRWQFAVSIHKATSRGFECVHRMDDPTAYATRDEAEDAAYRAARAWVDAQCKVN